MKVPSVSPIRLFLTLKSTPLTLSRIQAAHMLNPKSIIRSSRKVRPKETKHLSNPSWSCIDQTFTLRRTLERRLTFRKPTIPVFLQSGIRLSGSCTSLGLRLLNGCQRNSFNLSDFCIRTVKVSFMHTAFFHPSSPVVMSSGYQ